MPSNGATFGEKHTYRDWGLIPAARAEISPAEPKYNMVEIPCSDNVIDETESLDGKIHYDQRTYSQDFLVLEPRKRWFTIYSEIQNYLQGKRLKMTLDEDHSYYYEGRFEVNEWRSDKGYSTISIKGTMYPYKLEQVSSLEDWLWDPFDFENGVIREYAGLTVDGTLEVTIPGSRMVVVPVITASAAMTVEFEGQTYDLIEGENEIPEIEIFDGENVLTFTGSGTVSIDYRGGSL